MGGLARLASSADDGLETGQPFPLTGPGPGLQGALAGHLTIEVLSAVFGSFGPVLKMVVQPASSTEKLAFVQYADLTAAQAAKQGLPGNRLSPAAFAAAAEAAAAAAAEAAAAEATPAPAAEATRAAIDTLAAGQDSTEPGTAEAVAQEQQEEDGHQSQAVDAQGQQEEGAAAPEQPSAAQDAGAVQSASAAAPPAEEASEPAAQTPASPAPTDKADSDTEEDVEQAPETGSTEPEAAGLVAPTVTSASAPQAAPTSAAPGPLADPGPSGAEVAAELQAQGTELPLVESASYCAQRNLLVSAQSAATRDFTRPGLAWGEPNWAYLRGLLPAPEPGGATRVLSVTFDAATHPVTLEGLHTICSTYGTVQKIHAYDRDSRPVALVQARGFDGGFVGIRIYFADAGLCE